jgi:hypothetical protein
LAEVGLADFSIARVRIFNYQGFGIGRITEVYFHCLKFLLKTSELDKMTLDLLGIRLLVSRHFRRGIERDEMVKVLGREAKITDKNRTAIEEAKILLLG